MEFLCYALLRFGKPGSIQPTAESKIPMDGKCRIWTEWEGYSIHGELCEFVSFLLPFVLPVGSKSHDRYKELCKKCTHWNAIKVAFEVFILFRSLTTSNAYIRTFTLL